MKKKTLKKQAKAARHGKSVKKKAGVKGKKGTKGKMKWYEILADLEHASRIMLVGPPGTGKSRTSVEVSEKRTNGSQNVYRLTMTEGSGVEDLLGMFHLIAGETKWQDGPAVKALRQGATLIIDEVDRYSPEVCSLLYALLDDNPAVTLPTGEHVVAAEGYRVICTSNQSISVLPEPIMDRIEAVLIANVPHPSALQDLEKAEAAAVTNYYRGVTAAEWAWNGSPTVRRMRAFSKLTKGLKKEAQANKDIVADAVFGKSGKEVLSALTTSHYWLSMLGLRR
jgi:hypothetical protein